MTPKQSFLQELKANPIWQTIVDDLQPLPLQRYNVLDKKLSHDAQTNTWVYQSGRSDENDRILRILNVKE